MFELRIPSSAPKENLIAFIEHFMEGLCGEDRFGDSWGLVEALLDGEPSHEEPDEDDFAKAPLAVYSKDRLPLHRLLQALQSEEQLGCELGLCSLREMIDDEWQSSWLPQFIPFQTRCFTVVPVDWKDEVQVVGECIVVEEGGAFGTGQHATTRSAIEALEWLREDSSLGRVLDVGCGTGLLAIVAAKLGATHVVATEMDDAAVNVSRNNLARAGVDADLHHTSRIPKELSPFDVVIANILTEALLPLIPDLCACLKKDGHLILSGFPFSERARFDAAAGKLGLSTIQQFPLRGWGTTVYRGIGKKV